MQASLIGDDTTPRRGGVDRRPVLIRSQCGEPEHVGGDGNLRERKLISDDPGSGGKDALEQIKEVFERGTGVRQLSLSDLASSAMRERTEHTELQK